MKKSLLVMLLALLSSFMFLGISQAGQCIYLHTYYGRSFCYDSSDVKYSGAIVSFVLYGNNACKWDEFTADEEIDCTRRMIRFYDKDWSEWESIAPGSYDDVKMQKLCR
jgi:hypothetical protein